MSCVRRSLKVRMSTTWWRLLEPGFILFDLSRQDNTHRITFILNRIYRISNPGPLSPQSPVDGYEENMEGNLHLLCRTAVIFLDTEYKVVTVYFHHVKLFQVVLPQGNMSNPLMLHSTHLNPFDHKRHKAITKRHIENQKMLKTMTKRNKTPIKKHKERPKNH